VDYLSLGLAIGADRILRKPFDLAALQTALNEVLATRNLVASPATPLRRRDFA
jgi:DNA-binding response OmpR family regulator